MTDNHDRWQYVVASWDDPDCWFYETEAEAQVAVKEVRDRNPGWSYAVFKRMPEGGE